MAEVNIEYELPQTQICMTLTEGPLQRAVKASTTQLTRTHRNYLPVVGAGDLTCGDAASRTSGGVGNACSNDTPGKSSTA